MTNDEAKAIIEFYISIMTQTAKEMNNVSGGSSSELVSFFDEIEKRYDNLMKQVQPEIHPFVTMANDIGAGFCGCFPPDLIEILKKEGYQIKPN